LSLQIIFNMVISLTLISLMTSCNDDPSYEAEVEIEYVTTQAISKPNESEVTRYAKVNYCVKNTCGNVIHGWEVFFNVALQKGTNITATDNIYYTLKPGEISEVQAATARIPYYYENARNASLKNIEIW